MTKNFCNDGIYFRKVSPWFESIHAQKIYWPAFKLTSHFEIVLMLILRTVFSLFHQCHADQYFSNIDFSFDCKQFVSIIKSQATVIIILYCIFNSVDVFWQFLTYIKILLCFRIDVLNADVKMFIMRTVMWQQQQQQQPKKMIS